MRTLKIVGSGALRAKTLYENGQDRAMRQMYQKIINNVSPLNRSWLFKTSEQLVDSIPEHISEEFELVSEITEIPLIGIVILNCFDELVRLADLRRYFKTAYCSSLAIISGDHDESKVVVGRNLDYGFLLTELRSECRRYYHQNHGNGHDYVSWSWPGFFGVATGLNSEGLWLATHNSESLRQSADGVANSILNRLVLETASSINEACEIIHSHPPTCASNLMLADFSKGDVRVIEVDNAAMDIRSPQIVRSNKPTQLKKYIACANHFIKMSGATSGDSFLRQYYLESEAQKITQAEINSLIQIMASQGIFNDTTIYSLITDGNKITEQIADGLKPEIGRYEKSTVEY